MTPVNSDTGESPCSLLCSNTGEISLCRISSLDSPVVRLPQLAPARHSRPLRLCFHNYQNIRPSSITSNIKPLPQLSIFIYLHKITFNLNPSSLFETRYPSKGEEGKSHYKWGGTSFLYAGGDGGSGAGQRKPSCIFRQTAHSTSTTVLHQDGKFVAFEDNNPSAFRMEMFLEMKVSMSIGIQMTSLKFYRER